MTGKERIASAAQGIKPDRIPFVPTLFEHAAFLIGQTPSTAARSASLMAQAHIEAYRRYRPDAVTVGIDVYNVEAEALGCHVRWYDNASIPGIVTHPLTIGDSLERIAFSLDLGRINMMLDAAFKVKRIIGHEVNVGLGICGPFSIMIELLGFEAAIEALYDEDEWARRLLETLLGFQKCYCDEIAARGLSVAVFESWASPPLLSPGMYREFAFPYERELFAHLGRLGIPSRPLVIGGDTRNIADSILETGATLLVSDYNTPLYLYIQKAREKNILVRANIDPKLVQSSSWGQVRERVTEIRKQAEKYPRLLAGTGVIPYDTSPENILHVKQMLEEDEL